MGHNPGACRAQGELEAVAQRYQALILATRCDHKKAPDSFQSVDIDSLELVRPRRVGIESMVLHAIGQVGLRGKLAAIT